METLELMGKVAGIGGLALGTFLILFRDVIRRSIFSKLTRGQSYSLLRLILVLVWSIAIAGIAAWLVAARIAQTDQPSKKVVVAMDSPLRVYDRKDHEPPSGRTNTAEIFKALRDVEGLSLAQVSTNLDWDRDEEVKSKKPAMIILHLSAFASETQSPDTGHREERQLLRILESLADSKAQFLVYSRDLALEDIEGQQAWIEYVEEKIPSLKGRINFFNFVPGKPKVFDDAEVHRELKLQVRNILGLH